MTPTELWEAIIASIALYSAAIGNCRALRFPDGLFKDHDNFAQSMVDAHVHLAHGIVRYMGLENAHDLAKFEVRGVGELVDLISKVNG